MLTNARRYQRGLRAWMRDEEDDDAVAAGENFAEVLAMLRQLMVKG